MAKIKFKKAAKEKQIAAKMAMRARDPLCTGKAIRERKVEAGRRAVTYPPPKAFHLQDVSTGILGNCNKSLAVQISLVLPFPLIPYVLRHLFVNGLLLRPPFLSRCWSEVAPGGRRTLLLGGGRRWNSDAPPDLSARIHVEANLVSRAGPERLEVTGRHLVDVGDA